MQDPVRLWLSLEDMDSSLRWGAEIREISHARDDRAEDLLDALRTRLDEGVVVHIAGRDEPPTTVARANGAANPYLDLLRKIAFKRPLTSLV